MAAVAVAVLAVAGALTGCGASHGSRNASGTGTPALTRAHLMSAGPAQISAERAAAAILRAVPGRIAVLEVDDEDGRAVWEADVLADDGAWHEVLLGGSDGRIHGDRRDAHAGSERTGTVRTAAVTAARAAAVASRRGAGAVVGVVLGDRNGRPLWEVAVVGPRGADRKVLVDAATGAVVPPAMVIPGARRSSAPAGMSAATARVTARQAAEAASRAVPGRVAGLDLDVDEDRFVWEAEVLAADGTWRQVRLDAHDAALLGVYPDTSVRGDGAARARALRAAGADAGRVAVDAPRAVPGMVVSVDLDRRDAVHVWYVEVVGTDGDKRELIVDPATGGIVAKPAGG
ncbi:PepSY domain-containing protein [Actinomadura kijaniata]|uniref:PepSY domain-containing protein n=1 Tax=Actinomadura kijaniata TaxID=46161 RepID=UPI003F1BEA25